jgi:UDP-glucose 4-epimerase
MQMSHILNTEILLPDYSWKGKLVLITGGLGFIGSTLAHRLVELEAEVLIVDGLAPEYGGNYQNVKGIEDKIRINISDVRDSHCLRWLVKDAQVIFNLAGQTSHMDSMTDPYTDLNINCVAQLHILEACRHENPGARIVFASTRQIYGRPLYLPVDENHPITPRDVNGINKAAGEQYHLLYAKVYDMWCSALRLTNTYGPRMRIKDARQTFLGIWLRMALENRPFEVWGGEQLRDFSFVDDTVAALMAVAENEAARGQVFNVGGLEVVSLLDVARMISREIGDATFSVTDFPADRKPIDIGDFYADDRMLRKKTGWVPAVSLEMGLRKTIRYYREHLEAYL